MFVLNTSSPDTSRRAPKNDPPTAVPSSRTRAPSIRWTPTRFSASFISVCLRWPFPRGADGGTDAPAGRPAIPGGRGVGRGGRRGDSPGDARRIRGRNRHPPPRGGPGLRRALRGLLRLSRGDPPRPAQRRGCRAPGRGGHLGVRPDGHRGCRPRRLAEERTPARIPIPRVLAGRLGSKVEAVQALDHLVPVRPLPVHATARRTPPELRVPGPHPIRNEVSHGLWRGGFNPGVAHGTAGEGVEDAEGDRRGDLADLLLHVHAPDSDRTGNAGRELLVAGEEDPTLGARLVDEAAIGHRLRICRVVAHEPEPARKAPEHVIAEDPHRTTAYSRSTPSPRRSTRVRRSRAACSSVAAPSPPARVGAVAPPRTALPTNTRSSSARPPCRKDQITVLPPSTRSVRIPRA